MPPAQDKSAPFWRINIGHVSSICVTLLAILGFFLTYDRQIQANTTGLSNHIREHEIEVKNRSADKITEASARATADLIVHERLKALEDSKAQIQPQLSRMDEKLNWITDWIKEQKSRKTVNP